MGCNSCASSTIDGVTAGCNNNGGCATGGCNKLNVFDWLSDMELPMQNRFDIVEVRFKNGRKEFFRNVDNLMLSTGEAVVVDVPNGHHIGYVSLQGELVRLQMKKKGVENNDEIRAIYRTATLKDLEKYDDIRKRENPTMYRTREIIQEQKLQMKLTDVEYQADNTKATFYYSAEERVDFRELIKVLASEFKIRIEMRQISLRQEAGRLGGIGSCGRELCCSTWLSEFKSVSTSAARYQNLSLNPAKLSGQCGRLKCCLNYELDTYMDALKDIPEIVDALETQQGKAKLQKTDIFRKIMWFGYDDEANWMPLDVERVIEIQEMNKKGQKPVSLTEDEIDLAELNTSINSDLEKLDRKFSEGKNKKNRKKKKNKNRPNSKRPDQNQPQAKTSADPKNNQPKKHHNKNRRNKGRKNSGQNNNRPDQKKE